MKTVAVSLHPEVIKLKPSTILSHTVNAFSAYVSHGLPVIRPDLRDEHTPDVGYVQKLVYKLIEYGIKGNKFQPVAHIPLDSECAMLIKSIGLRRTMRIVGMAWDCYLFDNDRVLRSGEVIDLLQFMQIRDFIGHILIGYLEEYNYEVLVAPACEAKVASQISLP